MSRRSNFLIFCIINLAFFATSCATGGLQANGVFKKRDAQYHIGNPGPGWKRIYIKSADLAWVSEDGATLLANSSCKNPSDASLVALTWQLLIGMTEQKIISQTTLPWAQREALETIASAKMDGVPQRLSLFVLKKNGCVYDIVLSSSMGTFEKNVEGYRNVRDQFDAGEKL